MSDAEFKQALRDFLLSRTGYPPITVPLCLNSDHSIDRTETLSLQCYADFKIKEV